MNKTKTLTDNQYKLIELISLGDFWEENGPDDGHSEITSLKRIADHLECSIESARGVLGSLVADDLVGTEANDHAPDRPDWFWVHVGDEGVKLFKSHAAKN